MLFLWLMNFPGLHGQCFSIQKVRPTSAFKKLAKRLQNSYCSNIGSIRSDHGGEFQNEKFSAFCDKLGIFHNLFAPRTPHQNRVVERKNRLLEELARKILNKSSLPNTFGQM